MYNIGALLYIIFMGCTGDGRQSSLIQGRQGIIAPPSRGNDAIILRDVIKLKRKQIVSGKYINHSFCFNSLSLFYSICQVISYFWPFNPLWFSTFFLL